MTDHTRVPLTEQLLDEYDTVLQGAARIGSGIAPAAVAVLLGEVRRARAEMAALPDRLKATLTERFTDLGNPFGRMVVRKQGPDGWPMTDPVSPNGVADVLRELLTAAPDAGEDATAVEECGRCRTPFDPADARFDGHARYNATPYCRRCVGRCHDTEIADHRCIICA
ncbi:hypothetical protein [Streptomyces sp. NPDC059597]|uniref:hypothetical protein n=1 Tax=Streptomyces sp. NPDC059597 TaxID=3346879 RepID=UPI0036CB0064